MNLEKETWYQKKGVLILLLFTFPPLGILGIFNRKTKILKKIFYTLLGLFTSFLLLTWFFYLLLPNLSYSKGERFYSKGNYSKAIIEFQKVKKDDEYYNLALQKIELSKNKLDSILLFKKTIVLKNKKDSLTNIEVENNKTFSLKIFQKQWADSILKSESKLGNRHFTNIVLSLPDTILFEYTEGVTKNGFTTNFNLDKKKYPKHYKKALSKELGKNFLKFETYISFIPNQMVLSKNNPNDWKHPILLNKGLKIYKGNNFSKTYLGVLKCKYKDKERSVFDGNQFVIIEKENGELTRILRKELSKYYWIKTNDSNINSNRGLPKCY